MCVKLSWLLILLVWGTFRVLGARNAVPDEFVAREEAEWNFGQTLPVLLLIGPVLFIVRSIATHMPPCAKLEFSVFGHSTSSSSTSPSQRQYRKTDPSPERANTRHSTQTQVFQVSATSSSTDSCPPLPTNTIRHSVRHSWIGPCVALACLSLCLLAATVMDTIIDHESGQGKHVPTRPLFRFWTRNSKALPYLLLYHPLICYFTILTGLCMDHVSSLRQRERIRRAILLLIGLCVLGVYVSLTLYWPLYAPDWKYYPGLLSVDQPAQIVGLLITVGFYGIYAVGALVMGQRRMGAGREAPDVL